MPADPHHLRFTPASVVELMRVLDDDITANDISASEIATIADAAERDGYRAEAEALRAMVRNHRIGALEGLGCLSALRETYGLPRCDGL